MKEIVTLENREVIDRIEFNMPELISDKAEEIIKAKHQELVSLKEELYKARELVRLLEAKVDVARANFAKFETLGTIIYGTTNSEVIKNKVYGGVLGNKNVPNKI